MAKEHMLSVFHEIFPIDRKVDQPLGVLECPPAGLSGKHSFNPVMVMIAHDGCILLGTSDDHIFMALEPAGDLMHIKLTAAGEHTIICGNWDQVVQFMAVRRYENRKAAVDAQVVERMLELSMIMQQVHDRKADGLYRVKKLDVKIASF